MLNPALDWSALAHEYRRDQRICIDGVLQPAVAERVRAICTEKVPYDYVYYLDGANRVRSETELLETPAEEKARISQALMKNATAGIGFLYCSYMLNRYPRPADDLAFLYDLFDYFNSAEMMAFVRQVSGRDDLVRADAQYTRYSAGQYLTRHCDDVGGQARRLAYVLGFTRNWHPDWGGLLQFFEADGTPRDAWMPAFNRLALFDTRHLHAVTYLTPFAGEARLSLTGWFHAGTS